jgi:hypothetical protein
MVREPDSLPSRRSCPLTSGCMTARYNLAEGGEQVAVPPSERCLFLDCAQRNLDTAQAVGIPRAIVLLRVMADDGENQTEAQRGA